MKSKIKSDSDGLVSIETIASAAALDFGFTFPENARLLGPQTVLLNVLDEKSEKKQSIVLKCASQNTEMQHKILEDLGRFGFNCAASFFRTGEGKFVSLKENRYWTCASFIESGPVYDWLNFDCRPKQCFQAGQTLALLHRAGRRLLDEDAVFADGLHLQGQIKLLTKRLEAAFEKLQSPNVYSGKFRHGLESLKSLNQALVMETACLTIESLLNFERETAHTVIHGDYHPANILFDQTGVGAVLDWDYLCVGNGIFDLCYGLFMFCLDPTLKGTASPDFFNPVNTEAFLEAYTSSVPLLERMKQLASYSQYVHLLLFVWVVDELHNECSVYARHPNFSELARVLAILLSG